MSLHPLTIANIELQGISRKTELQTVYRCGCDCTPDQMAWRACEFHDGYDDGVDAAEVALARTLGGAA
jgi:hypothetical protein